MTNIQYILDGINKVLMNHNKIDYNAKIYTELINLLLINKLLYTNLLQKKIIIPDMGYIHI